MYSMWNAPSDRDYYDSISPEPPEEEEPEEEISDEDVETLIDRITLEDLVEEIEERERLA